MQTWGLSICMQFLFAVYIATRCIDASATYCAYSKQSVVRFSSLDKSTNEDGESDDFITGQLLDDYHTEKCPQSSKFCYALWQEDFANKNSTVILAQGCWESAAEFDCSEGECVSNKRPPKALNNTKFCCCFGNRCNENVSDGFFSSEEVEPAPRFVEHASYDTTTVIIAVVTMCSVAIIIMLAVCITYHLCSTTPKPSPDSAYLMELPAPSSPLFNMDSLKIRESIGAGRYGHVYRGTLYNQTVAVKIFAAQNRQNYLSERYIYCLPYMDHQCLPKLIGAEERIGVDDRPEYLLALSFAPKGCLQDFLINNTVDWPTFCKMAHTVTQGLAHLHTEIRKDGKVKMCIAHRDLTSRNILVKSDGSCMLCDFGFAICISGSKYYTSGEEQVAEATSLTDVGTLRYMAPEVLEGAVNLRDCESSLKQIDVYALGLVLWEMATRCYDLFQGVEVPEFKLPFVAEIGTHPSMEQMQVLVSRHKARPLFPDIWKDTNPAIRSLKETIEDCWDQDAEARLTALCVEERLNELPMLWDRHKAGSTIQGVSPTVNPMSTTQRVAPSTPAVQSSASTWSRGPCFELPVIKSNGEMSSPNNGLSLSRYCGDCSVSENTVETSITVSPSELTPNSCTSYSSNSGNNMKNLSANNSIVSSGVRVTVPLQPYQGKNPVMERNLVMNPVEDLTISGNSLVERKDALSSNGVTSRALHFPGDLFSSVQPADASETNALVSSDELSHSIRTCNPIPYVQNAVHVTSTIPKQPNVPGNGHVLHASFPIIAEDSKKSKSKRKGEEYKFISSLKKIFNFGRSSEVLQDCESPVSAPLISNASAPIVHVSKLQNCNGHLESFNTKPKESLDTEVYIECPNEDFSMTQTVVRPVANKQVYSQTVPCENAMEEVNVQNENNYPVAGTVVQSQTHPSLSVDYMGCATACSEKLHAKRPNTLPVTKFGSRRTPDFVPGIYIDRETVKPVVSDCSQISDTVNNQHNTNPTLLKNDRCSLYDDRMMFAELDPHVCFVPCVAKSPALQSSASVPQSIDSLCEAEASSFQESCQQGRAETSYLQ